MLPAREIRNKNPKTRKKEDLELKNFFNPTSKLVKYKKPNKRPKIAAPKQ